MDSRIQKAIELLICNFDQPLAVATLAHHFALSASQFAHLFRDEIGATPARCLRLIRLANAAGGETGEGGHTDRRY